LKRKFKIILLIFIFLIFSTIAIIYYKNKFIDNQPRKSKLVNYTEIEILNKYKTIAIFDVTP